MATFVSSFDNNEGTLTINYSGASGESSAGATADCNCGEDRSTTVRFQTDGPTPVAVEATINQKGLREQFIPSGETEGIRGSDGELFLTVKDEYENIPLECCDWGG